MEKLKSTVIASFLNFFAFSLTYAASFDTIFSNDSCDDYNCWISNVWGWAMTIIIPLATLVLIWAGIIYMTSEGDSDRVSLAKKLIKGVFSGVGLLVLARVLLAVIGVEGEAWNITG